MSQRCLDFEADLVISSQGAAKPAYTSHKVDRPGGNVPPAATRSRVPLGIGLHLNSLGAFAAPPKTSLQQCEVSRAEFGFSALSPESGRSLGLAVDDSLKRQANRSSVDDDAPAANTRSNVGKKKLLVEDNSNRPAPKRKRRSGSSDGSCKRCSCKKSKCLKLYCECFASGSFCLDSCACRDCSNKPEHEEIVLDVRQQIKSKNPLAFAPRVVPSETPADTPTQEGGHPASKHKRGCNCKRSLCLKKYCECYQAGVGCSESCKCTSCKNTFGVKQGSPECAEVDDDEAGMLPSDDVTEDRVSPACLPRFTTIKDFESPVQQASTCSKSSSNFHTFGTPLHGVCSDVSPELSRSRTGTPDSCQRHNGPRTNLITRATTSTSSQDRGPMSSVITVSSNQGFRSNSLRPGLHTLQSKVLEDGVPDFLLDPAEVDSTTVTSSPKKKRVTASQVGIAGKIVELPPVLKNGRKLTLQALPGLPPVSLIRERSRKT